jgi:hypothetical protein
MASIINRLSGIAPAILLPVYVIATRQKKTACVLLVFLSICLSGCFLHYYSVNTAPRVDDSVLERLQSANKYFILHARNGAYALKNLRVNNDLLQGDLEELPGEHLKYLVPGQGKLHRFPVRDRYIVLYEVHLYTTQAAGDSARISLALKDINRMDVYDLNKAATTTSEVLSIVGITVAGIALIGGIAFLITCNCPQVYTGDGNKYEFTGALYSGAIYASLERQDYMPLPHIQPVGNQLLLKINNVQGEEQIINELKLLQVTHDPRDQALVDKYGQVLVFRHPVDPDHGQNHYPFNNRSADQPTSDLTLDFKKPVGAGSGKLILHAKNSAWSGYLFHEFKALFGNYYAKWTAKKDRADPREMIRWQIDQGLPLLVSIKQNGSWKYIDYFATPGNTATREMIMSIDLSGISAEDHVHVRLQTAFMFWELDYAGMDFSEDSAYAATVLPATSLMKMGDDTTRALQQCPFQQSQLQQLGEKDSSYTHLTGRDFLQAVFTVDTARTPNRAISWFLQSSGYYHIGNSTEGPPQIGELKAFLENGAFDQFSRRKYQELQTLVKANAK